MRKVAGFTNVIYPVSSKLKTTSLVFFTNIWFRASLSRRVASACFRILISLSSSWFAWLNSVSFLTSSFNVWSSCITIVLNDSENSPMNSIRCVKSPEAIIFVCHVICLRFAWSVLSVPAIYPLKGTWFDRSPFDAAYKKSLSDIRLV